MSFKNRIFVLVQYIVPKHLLSRLIGILAECRISWLKTTFITWFVHHYDVNMDDAFIEDIEDYDSFNAFFTRTLKTSVRPIPDGDRYILSPADGTISQIGNIKQGRIFQAKGHEYHLAALLGGNENHALMFSGGAFATVYLSPRDYHRVHMPVTGSLREMTFIPGKLFSVNDISVRLVPNIFARNERVVCLFDTMHGPMAIILIGAMIVGSIVTTWAGQINSQEQRVKSVRYKEFANKTFQLERGEELGHFKLGSTVIVLFGPGRVNWRYTLGAGDSVRFGQEMGSARDDGS
ncbi:phosphatidylserine decarboxylase [Klebsiella huaxiensis]|uniref:archaetidylserine decarboxylase n=1 Tax=Klebsiella huaxiensis TaxID=2153354 RepID=UPI000DD39753|nr:archaetidylserine decarboxylase [Klebsiella huaxiensis]QBG08948.1 phosphatidylserine decarboxylase [Klebsiella huaxiensis]